MNEFLEPLCRPDNLSLYTVRRAVLSAVRRAAQEFKGELLDVGCGRSPYRSLIEPRLSRYLGMDLANNPIHRNQPDLLWDGKTIPLEENSVDWTMATEVLEHCPEPAQVLAEILRVLRPGGGFFFTVPFLWPLHEVPYDEYRYTPFAMARLLGAAGFENVQIRALGGWDASMAQMLGLWVSNRGFRQPIQWLLQHLTCPLIYVLTQKDVPPVNFGSHTMISGLWGTARKSSA